MIFEERQIEKNNFSSRAILLFGIVVLSLIAVLVQVFSLQISGYNDYQLAALKNKNYAVPVQALRGEIFDRDGEALIKNEPTFDLITRPNLISNIDSFLDEIQPGIGRTGKLFAFMDHDVAPDILVIGKGLGGGLPVGAFIADQKHMVKLKEAPSLGHITTFGGNPVIAAACRATLETILKSSLIENTINKEKLFRKLLIHPKIKEIRGKGLMLALIMDDAKIAQLLVKSCINEGVLLFFLLFEPAAVRISPPLTTVSYTHLRAHET